MTADSGTPSSSAPSASARPDPACSASEGCSRWWPDRLRCRAPRRASTTLPAVYATAPPAVPMTAGAGPASPYASPSSSNETADSSTPAPNAITEAMRSRGTRRV